MPEVQPISFVPSGDNVEKAEKLRALSAKSGLSINIIMNAILAQVGEVEFELMVKIHVPTPDELQNGQKISSHDMRKKGYFQSRKRNWMAGFNLK